VPGLEQLLISSCSILGNTQQEYHDGVPNGRELRKQRMQHDIYDDFNVKQNVTTIIM
jgi:hypothetical protein